VLWHRAKCLYILTTDTSLPPPQGDDDPVAMSYAADRGCVLPPQGDNDPVAMS
jgi:hypothetical protein